MTKFADIVKSLHDNFSYQPDLVEDWSIDYSGLQEGRGITGDCDDFVNALTCLLFKGGFNLNQIAICIMDTNPRDDNKYDHIITGVRIKGKDLYAHNWSDKVLTRRDIEFGGYPIEGGDAVGMAFIQFRILSTSKDNWLKGYPNYE